MCALISMAVYDTEQNQRTQYTRQTLENLYYTVDFTKHRLFIVDNGSCKETQELYLEFSIDVPKTSVEIINIGKNIGTAEAVNLGWRNRKAGEHCIKIDNDIVVHSKGWVDELEEVVSIDPAIGQIGLKRNDLWENVNHENPFYKTTLYQLPHKAGGRWIVVEIANHIIGSCVLHSSALLDKVGYLKQPSTYGLDDTLMSKRSQIAGFKNAFLPHLSIDHLDISPPKEWQKEKESVVSQSWIEYNRLISMYELDLKSIYYNPFE